MLAAMGFPHIAPAPSPPRPEMQAFGTSRPLVADGPRQLTEQDYERVDLLLRKRFAELAIEIIKLAAFCWVMVLALAVIVVSALR